ncbi:MAG: bifunctional diaminohydroxyphosphoribosylaminopyrimidine deaminase/5-amino-6-(5-phosphoribosylamino)uracil reductase RibD [Hyphomonadaceae bacterium]
MSARPSLEDDARFMTRALELAKAKLGRTAPNPSVGCVIVANGAIIAEGATADGGRPHAEEIALAAAGDGARGATAYVTLEPCNQRSGGTSSCSELLLAAGVVRVVISCDDPHPLGAHGADRLVNAGISIEHGLMGDEAERLNAGFFKLNATGRPWLVIDGDASSYDGGFALEGDETPEAALDRLGSRGLTRVFVRPGTALALELKVRGLVDEDRG